MAWFARFLLIQRLAFRVRLQCVAWLVWGAAVLGCASHQAQSTTPPVESVDNSSLGEGDVFDVRVYGEEELSGTYRVANDGSIDFPFIGNLRVAHMEPPAVAQAIRKALQDGGYLRQPQVSVLLKESNSKRISVVGAVQQPGTFPYTPGLTVVQAVSLAGGFNTIANKNQTIVTRRRGSKRVRFRVLVEEVTRGRAEDPALKAGDIVYVPERLF